MKYAFMSFSCPQLELSGMVAAARSYGYSGIEPRIGAGHRHGVETSAGADRRQAFKRMAEDSGIAICCVATGCSFVVPETAARHVEEAKAAIALAADIGAARLRVFGGDLPSGTRHAEALPLLVDSLAALSAFAGEHGVVVCLETHDSWTDPLLVAEVMRQVNHSHIAVNWDIAHPFRYHGYSMEQAYDALKPWIRHVHIHDGITGENNRFVFKPIGDGAIDHAAAIRLLQRGGYDGFLSGEWIDFEPHDIHLPREIAAAKRLEEAAS